MTRLEFLEFYDKVVKKLGERFEKEYPKFRFCNNSSSLYEEKLENNGISDGMIG